MIINIEKFKELLRKATVNYSIESVQLNFEKGLVESKMISSASDVIAILKTENDVLPELKTDMSFSFADPAQNLLPYLNLIDEAETVIKVSEEKITLLTGHQSSHVFFCSPQIVSVFGHTEPKASFPVFHQVKVDKSFNDTFEKIKKIGSKFGKVYFGVDKGSFYIETSDKTNKFSNSFRVDLSQVKYSDVSICLDYKNIVNLMSIIESDDFTMEFYYVKERGLGMVRTSNKSGSENYYLMSKKET